MNECCENCKKNLKLVEYVYDERGCTHLNLGGYACLAFIDEGEIIWMIGQNPKMGMCECYQPKEE